MSERQFKYLLMPGWVPSKNDGDRHYISSQQLAKLYGVDPRECRVYDSAWPYEKIMETWLSSLIVLRPQYDGDYAI